jgi:GNAT superfamily N-acetyltransferase
MSVEAAEANYLDAWRLLAGNVSTGIVEDDDELLFAAGGGRVGYFNAAFIKPPATPAACVGRAASFFRRRGLPFVVRFREDDGAADAIAACEAEELSAAGSSPVMVADIDSMAPLDGSIDVRSNDAETFGDHIEMVAQGFGLPAKVFGSFFTPTLLDSGRIEVFTAYDDSGAPVPTAALIETPGVAGVYNVATPEGFRRRGLGEATTRAVVDAGRRRGCALATLQASEMGYPVYERMGFRTAVRWLTFSGE